MKSEAATNTAAPAGAYPRFIGKAVLAAYVVVLLSTVIFWQSALMQRLLAGPVLMLSAAIAAVICFAAARHLARPARNLWLIMSAAGGLATVSGLSAALQTATVRIPGLHYLWLGSYALFVAALIVAVHEREQGRLTELALDVALVFTAAALVIVRWAPGAHLALTESSIATIALLVFAPTAALSAILFGSVLITAPQSSHALDALRGIGAAVACLTISAIPQIVSGAPCCHRGSWTLFAAIGMWVFLSYGAASAWAASDLPVAPSGGERLRQFVAPTVAIVLAAISIEAALNPPLGRRTAFALGVLGALVAMRLTELLNATRMQVTERRELAQTRALVEVSRALAGKNDLDATLKIVTQWAVRVLNARAAAVELLSQDARTLELRAAEGLPEGAIGMTFPVDNSFTGWVILNGEARVTANPRRDPFISAETLEVVGDSPLAAMPLRYRERLLGVLSCIGTRPFDAADLDLLRAFANQTALALEDARLFDQVRMLSVTDPLTGLANRRQLDRELTREFAAAERGRKLVAVMFDLDDFKQHNDRYGHIAGDDALRYFAEALHSTTRTMNLAARYGGDEFIALLADTDTRGAEVFISRVRDRFHRQMDAAGFPPLQVSAGLAEFSPEMKVPEDLIAAADRALYAAKFDADVSA